MAGETGIIPRLDRHAQVEFGRFVRDRLEASGSSELPADLDDLMHVLRFVPDDCESADGDD